MAALKRFAHKAKGVVGAGQHVGESDEFITLVNKTKHMKTDLDTIIKEANKYKEKVEESVAQGKKLAAALQNFGDDTERGKVMLQVAQMQQALEDMRLSMLEQMNVDFITPLTLLELDYKEYEKSKKAYDNGRTDYEIALGEVKEQKSKEKQDPQRLYAAEVKCTQSKSKYDILLDDALDKLVHVESRMDFVAMESCKGYLQTHQSYMDNNRSFSTQQIEPFMIQLESTIQHRKSEFISMKKERADDKMFQIDRQRKGRYFPLVEILGETKLDLMAVLCDEAQGGGSGDENLTMGIIVLDAFGLMQGLIKTSIEREVDATALNAPQTLFRLNSISTRLVVQFTKLVARPWVVDVLKPCLAQLTSKPDRSFEIDSSKMVEGETVETNVKKLVLATQFFLNGILNSKQNCPMALRRIFKTVYASVTKRFDEPAGLQSVGAFVFLRIFCPVIAAPQMFNLGDASSFTPQTKRALLLITKTITNLANGVLFGAKEPYMIPMNEFIETNLPAVKELLVDVTVVPENPDPQPPLATVEEVEKKELPMLHRNLVRDVEKISQKLTENNNAVVTQAQLAEVLGQLGPVKDL